MCFCVVLGDNYAALPKRRIWLWFCGAGALYAVCTNRVRKIPYGVRSRWRIGRLLQASMPLQWLCNKKEILAARMKYFCSSQSISYANTNPLLLVSGSGSRMFDENGVKYLDTRNNVPHVGHCHRGVAAAVADQVFTLNTNTRYLHPNVCELAKRLVATMPPGSELRETGVVFFVNSGSEANDLALRLCRVYTRRRGVIVVERGYHGHTMAVLGLSPYKYKHPLVGKPDHVQEIEAPDTYRRKGAVVESSPKAQIKSAMSTLRDRGHDLCAFFMESGMSVAGVLSPPPGYLQDAYAQVRDFGGLCVADEVQTGLGRTGNSWYAFESHGVVPDIVTLGKPLGNGMPLAAVVAVGRCAEAFSKGPEYFNTFGGNPVCAAAGLAVLDAIADDELRQNAAAVGDHLASELRKLTFFQDGLVHVGDVRGSGLFLGADLVKDVQTKEPATKEASLICSKLVHKHRILTTLDGEFDNVIVIKPPLCFSMRDANIFLRALKTEMLAIKSTQDLTAVTHTPT